MRGVLIDDDEAVARLRHDVSFVHLRARRPERMIEAHRRSEPRMRLASSARNRRRAPAPSRFAAGAPTSNEACVRSAKPQAARP